MPGTYRLLTVRTCRPELPPPTRLEEGNSKSFPAVREEGSLANTGKKKNCIVSMVGCGNDMALFRADF